MTLENTHLELLGHKVEDVLTGFEGVIVSISFDISGCVQGFVLPRVDKEGKVPEGRRVDTKRLKNVAIGPMMQQPTFSAIPGGDELPAHHSLPAPHTGAGA